MEDMFDSLPGGDENDGGFSFENNNQGVEDFFGGMNQEDGYEAEAMNSEYQDMSMTQQDNLEMSAENDPFGMMPVNTVQVEEEEDAFKAQGDEEEEDLEEDDEEDITILSIWQGKRAKHLQQKKEKEVADKLELKNQARAALENFYTKRDEKIAATKAENRLQQAQIEETTFGEDWTGVGQILGDSLTKPKRGMSGHADKTNRYRKLLIQLAHSY